MAKCPQPIFVRKTQLSVPCGKCAACRARKANDWIIRLNEEFKHSRSAYFVTLTYNELTVPLVDSLKINEETGELYTTKVQTLVKSDLQDFINLLRQYAPFRYFGIGEYGDKGDRPHYHILIFNFSPFVNPHTNTIVYHRDYKYITADMLASNVDIEAVILKAWKKGIVKVENLKGGAIRYLANYMVDTTINSVHTEQLRVFALMSKRPPIGYQYYSNKEVQKYHQKGEVNEKFKYHSDTGQYALPRLYKNKLFTKFQRDKFNKYTAEQEAKQLNKVKDFRRYSKNIHESQELKNDLLKKRNPRRSL